MEMIGKGSCTPGSGRSTPYPRSVSSGVTNPSILVRERDQAPAVITTVSAAILPASLISIPTTRSPRPCEANYRVVHQAPAGFDHLLSQENA